MGPSLCTVSLDGVWVVSGVFSIPLEACSSPSFEAGPNGSPDMQGLREYIGSDENRLVQVAVESLFADANHYRPLVFYGPSGTGKTLLASGLAERWRRARPHDTVVLTCGADYARSLAYAIDTDSVTEWRTRSAAAQLFVLDDLQQLQNKLPAQEELSHLLDRLVDSGRAVLVTSLQVPNPGDGLLPGLCSRLAAGLTVPLLAPGASARRVLLQRMAHLYAVPLSDAALDLLVSGPSEVDSNRLTVPQLNHAVVQLAYAAGREAAAIDPEHIRLFWQEQPDLRQPTLRTIAVRVAKQFGLALSELRGPSRRSNVVRARGLAMLLARNLTDASLETIGKFFGDRDHTTVLHACRKTEASRVDDPALTQAWDAVLTQLRSPQPHS